MTEHTMRDDWICFTHTFEDGGEVYIETKLKTTLEQDMQKAIEMVEVTRNVGRYAHGCAAKLKRNTAV